MGDQHVQAPLTRTQAVMGWLRNVIFYKVGRLVVAGARKTLTNDMLPKVRVCGAPKCANVAVRGQSAHMLIALCCHVQSVAFASQWSRRVLGAL